MEYRRLGQSDLQVSSIGLGCVTFGREIDSDTSFQIMDAAVDRGVTFFDTAMLYGDGASEQIIGDWLTARRARDKIVLATKVDGDLNRQRVLDSCENSLRRLATDVIDLYQLHN